MQFRVFIILLISNHCLSQTLHLQGGMTYSGVSYNIYANNISFIRGYNDNIISPNIGVGIEYFERDNLSMMTTISYNTVGGDLSSDNYGAIYKTYGFLQSLRLNKISLAQQFKIKPFKVNNLTPYIITGVYSDFIFSKSKIIDANNYLFYKQYEEETKKILLGLSGGVGLSYIKNRVGLNMNVIYQKPMSSFVSAEYINTFLTHTKGDYFAVNFLFGISYNLSNSKL